MIKKILIFSIFLTTLSAHAYEDCIITSDGKLTDIKIQDPSVVNIYPVVTVMNEKNTFIIHPLKEGKTSVCVLKEGSNIIDFEVSVKGDETVVEEVDGLEFLTLDEPETPFELDTPPSVKQKEASNG